MAQRFTKPLIIYRNNGALPLGPHPPLLSNCCFTHARREAPCRYYDDTKSISIEGDTEGTIGGTIGGTTGLTLGIEHHEIRGCYRAETYVYGGERDRRSGVSGCLSLSITSFSVNCLPYKLVSRRLLKYRPVRGDKRRYSHEAAHREIRRVYQPAR